jgi:phage terminase large subunit GpA-like protein
MHFPLSVDEEYFLQMTAESLIKIREKGEVKFLWKKNRERNEALDAAVYANAALMALNPNLEQYAAMIAAQAREIEKNIPVPAGMRPRIRRVASKGIGG